MFRDHILVVLGSVYPTKDLFGLGAVALHVFDKFVFVERPFAVDLSLGNVVGHFSLGVVVGHGVVFRLRRRLANGKLLIFRSLEVLGALEFYRFVVGAVDGGVMGDGVGRMGVLYIRWKKTHGFGRVMHRVCVALVLAKITQLYESLWWP